MSDIEWFAQLLEQLKESAELMPDNDFARGQANGFTLALEALAVIR